MRLYRYNVYCGRMGSLQGLFAVDEVGEACLRALIASRRDIYFGEVLGKHSEVVQVLEANEVTRVEATPDEVATVLRVLGIEFSSPVAVINGFCPLQCDGTCEIDGDPAALLAWAKGEEPDDESEEE